MITRMKKGIGYQEYRQKRIAEGISPSEIENPGNERYLIYFGRAHLFDHESMHLSRGFLKIGRGKFATAIQRGRNQPGVDFRIYGEIILDSNNATYSAESIIKDFLSHRHMEFDQGQDEMYDIKDDELENIIKTVSEIIDAKTNHKILEINLYLDSSKIIEYTKAVKKKSKSISIQHFHSFFE